MDDPIDSYGCVKAPHAGSAASLRARVAGWRARAEVRGAWLALTLDSRDALDSLEAALSSGLGFRIHHAEGRDVTLGAWFGDAARGYPLPAGPTHTVGVGALVVDAERERVLVVRERTGPAAAEQRWKMVTGLVDRAEDVAAAAAREVLEEASVRTAFVEVVGLREGHQHQPFGASNLFFVCVLEALSREISVDGSELAEAKWIAFEEYERLPSYAPGTVYHELARLALEAARELARARGVAGAAEKRARLSHRALPLGPKFPDAKQTVWSVSLVELSGSRVAGSADVSAPATADVARDGASLAGGEQGKL